MVEKVFQQIFVLIIDIKMCIRLRSFFGNSLNINQEMLDLKIAFSTLLLVFNNKAENTTKMVVLPCLLIAGLLFSSLSSYCKTNGELKSPSCPPCNYVFLLFFRVSSKSSINLSVDAEYAPSVSKWVLQFCCNLSFTRLSLFFLLFCLLYVVCALLVPFFWLTGY